MGQALAGGLGGWALGWIGYQQVQQGAPRIEQTQDVLDGIWMWFTLIPGVVFLCVALALAFLYPLNKRLVNENAAFLAAKRDVVEA